MPSRNLEARSVGNAVKWSELMLNTFGPTTLRHYIDSKDAALAQSILDNVAAINQVLAQKVNRSGDTFTGPVYLLNASTAPNSPVTHDMLDVRVNQLLGWRNRASKLAEKLGVVVTPELNADRQKWGTEGVNRMAGPTAVRGWSLFRMGSHYQLYAVYDLAFTLCFRFNWGFKVWGADNGEPQAMVINIAGSIIGDQDDE